MHRCKECGGKCFVDHVRGEIVCEECGLTAPYEEGSFVCMPPYKKEVRIRKISWEEAAMERRIKRIEKRIENNKDYDKVKKKCFALLKWHNIPDYVINDVAYYTYKLLKSEKRLNIEATIKTIGYMVMKNYAIVCPFRASMKEMRRIREKLEKHGIRLTTIMSKESYIANICRKFNLNFDIQSEALAIVKSVKECCPATAAALAVLLACERQGREITMSEIAEAVNISTSTVSYAMKRLELSDRDTRKIYTMQQLKATLQ